VDDDESARLLMRSVLEKLDFNVLEAEDGPPALRTLLDRGDISLVMLDLNMPEMNGQAVLERIRKTMATAGLPVIVLTGIEDPAVEIALLEAGADDYLRKPIDPERLRVRVKAVLRRAGVLQPA
jgi:DNA-binding response OmpR family regulator